MCVSLFLTLFLWIHRSELLGSAGSGVRVLNKPGGGKTMYSVFEGFFPVTMCISRPNQAKWLERRVIPLSVSVLD